MNATHCDNCDRRHPGSKDERWIRIGGGWPMGLDACSPECAVALVPRAFELAAQDPDEVDF